MEKSHLEKIEYILARSLFQKSSYDETDIKKNEDEFLHYKNNLLNISEIEINTIYSCVEEEEKYYYSKINSFADFSFWSRAAYWKIDEAVSLIFGKNPGILTPEKIARTQIFRDFREGALCNSYKHIMPKLAPLCVQYLKLYGLAHRAVEAEILSDPVKPAQFIEWLKQLRLPVPERLEAALRENGVHIHDWRAAFERLQRDSEAERAAAADEIAKLKAEHEKFRKDEIKTRERETLLKMIIGMAVKGYGYDPSLKRSDCAKEIFNDLDDLKLKIDEDTIRKWLKAAAAVHTVKSSKES